MFNLNVCFEWNILYPTFSNWGDMKYWLIIHQKSMAKESKDSGCWLKNLKGPFACSYNLKIHLSISGAALSVLLALIAICILKLEVQIKGSLIFFYFLLLKASETSHLKVAIRPSCHLVLPKKQEKKNGCMTISCPQGNFLLWKSILLIFWRNRKYY